MWPFSSDDMVDTWVVTYKLPGAEDVFQFTVKADTIVCRLVKTTEDMMSWLRSEIALDQVDQNFNEMLPVQQELESLYDELTFAWSYLSEAQGFFLEGDYEQAEASLGMYHSELFDIYEDDFGAIDLPTEVKK